MAGIVRQGTEAWLIAAEVIPQLTSIISPNISSSDFWSASPISGYSYYAWNVNFYYGGADGSYRASSWLVRLVRSGQ